MNGFYELEKNKKRLRTLILGLGSMIKVLKWTLKDLFHFSEVRKSKKNNFPIDNTVHFYPCKTFKNAISLPKHLKLTFINYIKGIFYENDLKNIKNNIKP